ncbi:MAG TPA: hypothetical protein ENK26_03970 [Gammaproteobacteria bacterium]|nr:hypothetical protein [Gammaproteobacteria bacterium]
MNTSIGDGGQLAHASCLLEGQRIEPGARYHGNPAEPTDTRFDFGRHFEISRWRPVEYPPGRSTEPIAWASVSPLWALRDDAG